MKLRAALLSDLSDSAGSPGRATPEPRSRAPRGALPAVFGPFGQPVWPAAARLFEGFQWNWGWILAARGV